MSTDNLIGDWLQELKVTRDRAKHAEDLVERAAELLRSPDSLAPTSNVWLEQRDQWLRDAGQE